MTSSLRGMARGLTANWTPWYGAIERVNREVEAVVARRIKLRIVSPLRNRTWR